MPDFAEPNEQSGATVARQAHNLEVAGSTPASAPIRFVQARHYTEAERTAVDLVVLHDMESSERLDTAENVAAWLADLRKAPRASANYCVDADSIVQCVRDKDIAWAAPGANHNGLHVELAGRADQNAREWEDEYSMRVLNRAIDLVASLCRRWSIPARLIGPDGLILGHRGITTHAFVSQAFHRSTHYDPGPYFPLDWFIGRVASRLTQE